jgi:hypothetical protein
LWWCSKFAQRSTLVPWCSKLFSPFRFREFFIKRKKGNFLLIYRLTLFDVF